MKDYLVANRSVYDDTAVEFEAKGHVRVPDKERLADLFLGALDVYKPAANYSF